MLYGLVVREVQRISEHYRLVPRFPANPSIISLGRTSQRLRVIRQHLSNAPDGTSITNL